MAVFYLLPPRPFLGDRFAAFLQTFFPGLAWEGETRLRLAEVYAAALVDRPDVFIVYRDDLPEGEALGEALVDGYGAEPGDEVVEVRPGGRAGEVVTSRWKLPPRSVVAARTPIQGSSQVAMPEAAHAPSPPASRSAVRN